jgi:hypothetical protein
VHQRESGAKTREIVKTNFELVQSAKPKKLSNALKLYQQYTCPALYTRVKNFTSTKVIRAKNLSKALQPLPF